MHETSDKPRALFLFSRGVLKPDHLICSGKLINIFEGVCVYSDDGRLPALIRLDAEWMRGGKKLGGEGEFAPACALEHVGSLEAWQMVSGEEYPKEYLPLRVFKCRQMMLLIVPGIRHDRANVWID